MYVPKFGPRLERRVHVKHMEKIGTVMLYRFTNRNRAWERPVNILFAGTGKLDNKIYRIIEQMRVWGYTYADRSVRNDIADWCDPRGPPQACLDADILIVGSSKHRDPAARYLLNLVRGGWFGIMPHWDVLWYGLNDGSQQGGKRAAKRRAARNRKNGRVPEGGPEMFGVGPVRTGPEFVQDAVDMIHAHIERRSDPGEILGCMRSLWAEVSAGLAALSEGVEPQDAGSGGCGDPVAAFRETLDSKGAGGSPDARLLFDALETLRDCGASLAGGRGAEKRAYLLAHTVLQWIGDYSSESVWTDWHGRALGKPPKESLLHSVRRRQDWLELGKSMVEQASGFRWQAMVTVLLAKQGMAVTGVECSRPERGYGCGCSCGGCADTRCSCGCTVCAGHGGYDIDLMVGMDRLDVPMQVASFAGAPGCGAGPVRPRGWDTLRIREKLRQTPPMGIALMVCHFQGSVNMRPNVNWWHGGVRDKCLVMLNASGGKSVIYHSAPRALVEAAVRVCRALGSKAPVIRRVWSRPGSGGCPHFCPDTVEGMVAAMERDPGRWAADVTGALRYPEYVGAYCHNMADLAGLAPAVRHAAEMYARHGGNWGSALDRSLDALDGVIVKRRAVPGLADAARVLHGALGCLDAARPRNGRAGGQDADAREGRFLHILDCMARTVSRLGAGAPPEALKALTAAARGGSRRRAVLGARLGELAAGQPEWYAKNERLLFGAPRGLGADLMGTMMDGIAWQPAMEKYPHLAYAAAPGVMNGSAGGDRMRVLMEYVLNGIQGYDDMEWTVRFLDDAGALGAAAEECARLAGRDARYRRAYARLRKAVRECAPGHAGELVPVKAAKRSGTARSGR